MDRHGFIGTGRESRQKLNYRRRAALVQLSLCPPTSVVAETFADGAALFDAVCKLGLEGVVAKRLLSRYGANQRGWIKTKNPSYWRRDSEREAMQRSRERRSAAPPLSTPG